jgi:uncharacterized protein YbjQ (UPF0145 family)
MDPASIQDANLLIRFVVPLSVLIGAYLVGSFLERRHFASIREREKALQGYPVTTFENLPESWQVGQSGMVAGSVVVSLDYFKRVIAGLRSLVGGRVKSYEPLLDRARREAILRMLESAKELGFDAVINVRLETSRLANAAHNGQGTAGVEMLAFGTGITIEHR